MKNIKKTVSLLLLLILVLTSVSACGKKEEKKDIRNILFLGDDLMQTSEVYNYFSDICKNNSHPEISVDFEVTDDARMYTYANRCKEDGEFAKRVANADMIIFEEGTAETQTTAESIDIIRSYAHNPVMVCLCFYGYPCWMYREMFEEKKVEGIKYADSDYFIKRIIAADDAPIGYEHLCFDDYIHPNELNGYLSALVCYCECFNTMPDSVDVGCFNADKRLSDCAGIELGKLPDLQKRLSDMITDEMR